MVTTKKWIREATAAGGRLMISVRLLPPVVLSGLVGVFLAMVLVGCGEPPGGRELNEGIRLLDAGKPAEAIAVFERAAGLFVTNQVARANALNYLGLAYHKAGQTDAANRAYQAALNENLNLVAARYNRGCLLLELGELDEATRELTTYVELRPASAEGWLRLGSVHLRAGRVPQAMEAFKEAGERAAKNPVKVQALNGAGVCLVREGRLADAGLFLDAAFKLDSQFAPVLLNQAILAERQSDIMGALSKYQTWLETAGNVPSRAAVEKHVQRLVQKLQPTLAGAGQATQEQLARLTNLFARVGSVGEVSSPAPETNPPPTAVETSGPAPTVAVASNPPPVVATATNPPPMIVAALPPHRPTIDTSPPPAISVALGPPPTTVATSVPPENLVAEVSPTGQQDTSATGIEKADTGGLVASADVTMLEESVPSRPELAMAAPVRSQPRPADETAPPPGDEAVEPDATAAESDGGEPAEKRSFLSKINPLNLFRREPREKRITPLPPRRGESAAPAAESLEEPPAVESPATPEPVAGADANPSPPEPVAMEPARPAYPRYTYISPALPETGDPEKAARLLEAAARAHQGGRYAEAAEGYEKAIKADPACFGARYNLATLELDRLRPNAALSEFESALVISPHDASARFNFALALEAAGYPLDAAIEMERAVADKPDNAAAHLMLGGLYSDALGDLATAREHFARVLAIEPNHPQAGHIRRWLSAHR